MRDTASAASPFAFDQPTEASTAPWLPAGNVVNAFQFTDLSPPQQPPKEACRDSASGVRQVFGAGTPVGGADGDVY